MKYTIKINQLVLSEEECFDVKDGAILSFLWDLHASVNPSIEGKRLSGHTWFDYNYLIREMPLLRITSKAGLSKRINKIIDKGYVSTIRKTVGGKPRLYFKPTVKMEALYTGQIVRPLTRANGTVNQSEPIIILDNNTSKSSDELVTPETDEKTEEKKKLNQQIKGLIYSFSTWNPAANRWYANTTQRNACELLLKSYDYELLVVMSRVYLPLSNQLEYVKNITTPLQLLDNIATYRNSLEREEFFETYKKEIAEGVNKIKEYNKQYDK